MFPFNLFAKWTPASARERLRKGRVPGEMRVAGHLDLANSGWLMRLPRVVEAASIDVSGCARLSELPEVVKCSALDLQRTHVKRLPASLNVSQRIHATDCEYLREVGALRVPVLILRGCPALEKLSDGLQVRHLDLSRCGRLAELPASTAKCLWDLDVSDCQCLTALPAGLVQLRTLNVRGCTNLRALPNDIRVLSWIEVADSGLESLPESVRSTQIVWQGIRVSYQIAFSSRDDHGSANPAGAECGAATRDARARGKGVVLRERATTGCRQRFRCGRHAAVVASALRRGGRFCVFGGALSVDRAEVFIASAAAIVFVRPGGGVAGGV